MAKATVRTEQVAVKTYEDKVTGVTLELTLDEANLIYRMVGYVLGGGALRTPADALWGALSTLRSKNPDIGLIANGSPFAATTHWRNE